MFWEIINLIIVILGLVGVYFLGTSIYPRYLYWTAWWWRRNFISWLEDNDIWQVDICGPPGTGKTNLLTILATHPSIIGTSHTSYPCYSQFINDSFSWMDIDLRSENREMPDPLSYICIDELSLFGDWTNPKTAAEEFPGVADYLKTARQYGHRLFYTNQRLDGGLWIEMRKLCRLFIFTDGYTKYPGFTLLNFTTSSDEKMEKNVKRWRFPVYDSDFQVYDSCWMKDFATIKNRFVGRSKRMAAKRLTQAIDILLESTKSPSAVNKAIDSMVDSLLEKTNANGNVPTGTSFPTIIEK